MKTLLLNKILIILVVIGSIAWDFEPASLTRSTMFQSAPPLQEKPVVARVFFADQADLNRLARELDIWEVHHREGYLVALLRADQYARLQQTGYRVELDQTQTTLQSQPLQRPPGWITSIPGYSCYRTITETYASLSQLTNTYPNLASWVDIGDSWDKFTPSGPDGYDLFALILTNKSKPGPKPKFFLMAEIHARELATAELATRFAERLVADYGLDPDITWLLDYNEIHIVPMTNPDGRKWAEQTYWWRKNTDSNDGCTTSDYGTDLNRNSSFGWGGSSTDPCNEEYQGPSAASEPETQAIQNYVASILPDQRGSGEDAAPITTTGVFITLHSYGELVLFPYWFRTTPTPNDRQLEILGRKFGYFNNYKVCQAGKINCEYAATGTTDDWAYGQLGVAAYTFEVGTAFFESCTSFEGTVLPKNLPALLYAFKAARRPYQSPAGPDSITVTVPLTLVIAGTPVTLTAVADDTRYNSNGGGILPEPVQNIAAARYTVDAPSWITGVVSYSMAPSDGAWSSPTETVRTVVNTAGWSPGRHLLLVESQDAVGNWGVPGAVFLRIAEQYGVTLTPAVAMGQAHPGQTVSYTLQLTNTGNVSDTFDLVASGNTWTTTVPSSVGPVTPGSRTDLTVTVNIPATAVGGATNTAIVTAASRADHTRSATATLTTTASFHALRVTPAASVQSADPGAQVTYTLWVTNTGNVSDTFDMSVAGNAWTTIVAPPVGPLAAGVGVPQSVSVSVPMTALAGTTDTAKITLASQGDPTQSSTSVLTTTTSAVYGLKVEPSAMVQSAKPGAQVMYTLWVTNTGNIADAFDVSIAGNAWTTIVVSQVGPLSPGNGADLGVIVSIPVTAPSGTMDAVQVTLTSQADRSKSFTPVLTTTCIVRGLALEPSVMAQSGAPGTSVTYTLHLTNTGDMTDTFALHHVGNTWDVHLWPAIGITLTPNVGSDVMVRVTIPLTVTGRLSDTVRVEVMGIGVYGVSVLTTQVIFQIYVPLVTNYYSVQSESRLQLKARLQRR